MPLEHARSLYEHARALFDKAHRGDAIAACRELVERYGASDDPAERAVVTLALLLQAQAFSSPWVARREEALALFDEVLRRIDEAGEVDKDGTIAADALLGRAGCLQLRDRFEDAIEACDTLERRIAGSTAPALRRRFADGQYQKVTFLVKLNRRDEAIAVCEAAVTRYGGGAEPELQDATARLLFEKGSLLLDAKRPDEALAAFEQLLASLQNESQPPFLEWIVAGSMPKGAALEREPVVSLLAPHVRTESGQLA